MNIEGATLVNQYMMYILSIDNSTPLPHVLTLDNLAHVRPVDYLTRVPDFTSLLRTRYDADAITQRLEVAMCHDLTISSLIADHFFDSIILLSSVLRSHVAMPLIFARVEYIRHLACTKHRDICTFLYARSTVSYILSSISSISQELSHPIQPYSLHA